MPSAAKKRTHGGVKRVRRKTLSGGRYVTIYYFKDGTTYADVQKRKE